jgi:hypothetical protein
MKKVAPLLFVLLVACQQQGVQPSQELSSNTVPPAEFSQWKEFDSRSLQWNHNLQFPFTFRYPQDWTLKLDERGVFLEGTPPSSNTFFFAIAPEWDVASGTDLAGTCKEILHARYNESYIYDSIQEQNGIVNGEPAYQVDFHLTENAKYISAGKTPAVITGRQICIVNGNRFSLIATPLDEKYLEQLNALVSTIRFAH